ncbi:Nucleotide-diphospho-sugar transferase family protein [Rhynchospora pubera]|uniref:Nucleotide-diphospho-sugar transferase family protein n=3 Tax=Rhynchospora pubera TaxID=906938 RepID=A0AAV8EHA2_9POAL|nr:Nucleotide-diphospho-sugar transferase family protein [Rhynchospora pubera]
MGDTSPLQSLISFLLGAAMAAVCIIFYTTANSKGERWSPISSWRDGAQMQSFKEINEQQLAQTKEIKARQELSVLLRKAAMDDNTVIITSLNEPFARPGSLLDLFLESFHVGEQIEHLLNHLVIVAMDPKAYQRCKEVHFYCYFLETKGVNYTSEKFFMTKDYLEMMWGRNGFQLSILELGYNFLFTDVDIMWFRNPLRHIAITSHIAISSDFFIGDEDSLSNFPNGGLLYARSCNTTIQFYRSWHNARDDFPGMHEQNVFNQIKKNYTEKFGVKLQFLNTAYCGGFCQLSHDFDKICTMHANCCVGLGSKVNDLKNVLNSWKYYKSFSLEERKGKKFQWKVPGICIH